LFALPAVSLLAMLWRAHAALAALVATISSPLGVGVENWLFFVEATHASLLYYGKAA
jgi:hypothetical protein